MSHKKGSKSKGGRHKKQSGEDSYGLQAIILADSYMQKRFRPITHCIPKMLIPLAGCPMINYSIDLLINSNVNEIYIICSSHAAQLEEYINSSQWKNARWFPKLKIHIIRIDDCNSVGAALRHMHTLNYIQSKTFILCRGDCVANISLSNIIKKHQQRYKTSTNTLMTCLFKTANHKHRTTSLEDDLFIVTNDNNELLQYENDRSNSNLSFDLTIFDEHDEIEIHHDIIDCGIDICSKTVLSLFEDNFDYESIRKELFEGVIRSEIYNYKIYASFLSNSNEYASRILDWKTYSGITLDIIERWTYPLVLDSNTVSHNYLFQRNNIYKEDGVKIGLQTEIKKNTILGYNTNIGNKCIITKSVIGSNCKIGNNCSIQNCYLFGDCHIDNNTKLNGVVIANNVKIGKNCNIPKGCILSFGVEIDDNMKLAQYTKITLNKNENDFDNDDDFGFDSDDNVQLLPKQNKIYKQSPKGRVRALSSTSNNNDNDSDNSNNSNNSNNEKKTTIMGIIDGGNINNNDDEETGDDIKYDTNIVGYNGKGYLYDDDSNVMDSINNVLATYSDRPHRGYLDIDQQQQQISNDIVINNIHLNDIGGPNGHKSSEQDEENKSNGLNLDKLILEISECIESAENNKSNMNDVVFEITTSVRLSHNAKLEDFSCAVFITLLNRISDDESFQDKKKKIEYYTTKYCCLFEKLSKKQDDQIKVIKGLYISCNTRQKGLIYFFLEGLDKLFYEDIVSLESIQKWNQTRNKTNDEKFEQYLAQYIEGWIDAEQDSDDDEDDDDDDDDDESD